MIDHNMLCLGWLGGLDLNMGMVQGIRQGCLGAACSCKHPLHGLGRCSPLMVSP